MNDLCKGDMLDLKSNVES